jgi:hypothetical protein
MPTPTEYVPAAQGVHRPLPLPYLPAGHWAQEVEVVDMP